MLSLKHLLHVET